MEGEVVSELQTAKDTNHATYLGDFATDALVGWLGLANEFVLFLVRGESLTSPKRCFGILTVRGDVSSTPRRFLRGDFHVDL